jgi:diacylglycerol kinase (ATP)
MKFKKIHFIINPASGSEEPILAYLNTLFEHTGINWEVSVIQREHNLKSILTSIMDKADLIAVYGGDGTVVEVAQILIGKNIPLAIIPAGTANVLAKELGIPIDTKQALALILKENAIIKCMDTGLMNKTPFLIRVNFGIMSEMIYNTNEMMKDNFGQLAYGISAIESLLETEKAIKYSMKIDGIEVVEEGVLLTVTNVGNLGIAGFSFLPNISVEDGLLDVILLNHADFLSILSVAGTTLFQSNSEVLKRWKCKEISIEFESSQKFICDDTVFVSKNIFIEANPKSLEILVPFETN